MGESRGKQRKQIVQLTLNFEAGLVTSYASCREYTAARIHQQPRPQKLIAADMDLSPSQLSRKCAQSPDDSARFTLDDLERYILVTGDANPVLYLVEKYLAKADPAEIRRQIQALEDRLRERSAA
jgi:hypothetical protein